MTKASLSRDLLPGALYRLVRLMNVTLTEA
jgi:hypothetical protein